MSSSGSLSPLLSWDRAGEDAGCGMKERQHTFQHVKYSDSEMYLSSRQALITNLIQSFGFIRLCLTLLLFFK